MEFSHLEKMGRELKCPICLSLLKSSAMLACNHVFCTSCIMESMKVVSNCPVCKLPFRRREVRPAPHMDNLVNIYKSMEAASGFTIFTTQVPPSENYDELQVAHDKKCNAPKSIMMPQESSRAKRSSKGKKKKIERFDSRTSDPCSTRPISSNKRVHVTPYPVSETPVPNKRASKSAISTTEAIDRSELENNKTIACKNKNDSMFSPFFWLSEANEEDEDIERMNAEEISSLVTPNVPCFSDIKDSDDVSTPKKTTSNSKSAAQEAFDSEMFEWTQRACSPELFSTPIKQTAGGDSFNKYHEDEHKIMSHGLRVHSRNLESPKTCHLYKNAKTTRTVYARKGIIRKKFIQNKDKQSSHETAITSFNENHPFCSNEIVNDSTQENESSKRIVSLRYTRKVDKKRAMLTSDKSTIIRTKSCMPSRLRENNGLADAHNVITTKSSKKIQSHDMENTSRILAELSPNKSFETVVAKQNECQKRAKKTILNSRKQSKRLSSSLVELETHDTNLLGDPSKDKPQSLEHEITNSRLHLSSFKQNGGKDSDRSNFRIDQIKIDARRHDKKKRQKTHNVDFFDATTQKEQHTSINNTLMEKNEPLMDLHKSCVTSKTKKMFQLNTNEVLRKCKNVHPTVRCAFCHSSNDLEVSGEMMHYFNGKSVSSDYNGGDNLIHCHRNCTEWAPDAFFKDDLVINLSAELARSARITCRCCGIKGAALGCFEKICRRSFHYPCAKRTPECRWDNENFVMLCPLHSSSKFPSETSLLQKRKRKTCESKREVPPTSQPKDAVEESCKWTWPPGLPCKWVLCSSALSSVEKETLSEFASLTNTLVSKNWSSAVTHIIASTDENGACKRTLKFLMGILEGKWILSIEWIKACMKLKKPVDEEKYEISIDVHGIRNGPLLGRMRIVNKEPKIFSSFWFYFIGEFVASYKGYLHDLITTAGGKVLHRRPILTKNKNQFDDSFGTTFIVYNLELSENSHNLDEKVVENRKVESIALAEDCGAKVVTNSWILDSIAASALQVLPS